MFESYNLLIIKYYSLYRRTEVISIQCIQSIKRYDKQRAH